MTLMPRTPRGRCIDCTHHAVLHANDRLRCETPGCDCGGFRSTTPVQFRDGHRAWDDDTNPRRRADFGAGGPSEWVEGYEVAE